MPCDQEVSFSFKFGGKTYPVHPLDTTMPFSELDSSGRTDCVGMVSFSLFYSRYILIPGR